MLSHRFGPTIVCVPEIHPDTIKLISISSVAVTTIVTLAPSTMYGRGNLVDRCVKHTENDLFKCVVWVCHDTRKLFPRFLLDRRLRVPPPASPDLC